MKSIIVWKLIRNSMERRVPVMLLYVLESKGSSPGRQGFFMAVNANGQMEGSIGGGMMEHKFVEMAKEKLITAKNQLPETGIKKQVHDKSAAKNQSGMICSGEQTIVLHAVHPEDTIAVEKIIASQEQHKNGCLILSPKGIQFDSNIPDNDFEFEMNSEEDWIYKEKTGYKNQLFIIGGGHCSLALSTLMFPMDFYIRVYDDRKDLKTMLENTSAHEKHFINNYEAVGTSIHSGQHQYVVIMTFGYRSDDIVVRSLLGKNFKFFGLLGSKTKIEKMFGDYRQQGFKEEWLQRIHTPVGLDIKSQTPEEIAVSIAAEIIKVKNK
ncbi:MAG: XdhC family protein [Chitinophagaceae bacterium]